MLVLIVTTSLTRALAQKCKPKVSEVDGFTEHKIEGCGVTFYFTVNNGSYHELKEYHK